MVTEGQAEITSEGHRVTEARAVTEGQAEITTSEVQMVTEVRAETTSEAHREDLREPLQMADAETGPATKVVPKIRIV